MELLNDIAKEYLFTLNNKEISQRKMEILFLIILLKQPMMKKSFFLSARNFYKNNQVFLSKHNRFADYPEHDHEFLNLTIC